MLTRKNIENFGAVVCFPTHIYVKSYGEPLNYQKDVFFYCLKKKFSRHSACPSMKEGLVI